MKAEPFEIAIPEEALDDLRDRLARTRLPEDFANAGWEYGTNVDYLRKLVAYWLDGFDWRREERAMNAFSHYRTTIEDVPIHFTIHFIQMPRGGHFAPFEEPELLVEDVRAFFRPLR